MLSATCHAAGYNVYYQIDLPPAAEAIYLHYVHDNSGVPVVTLYFTSSGCLDSMRSQAETTAVSGLTGYRWPHWACHHHTFHCDQYVVAQDISRSHFCQLLHNVDNFQCRLLHIVRL